jgi:glutathionyl-hydroquinone reductase
MGYFDNGEWKTGWYPSDDSGRFVRPPTSFRDRIESEDIRPGRYHLYVSMACPWAHRTLIAREIMGLQEYFSVSVVDWFLDDDGWAFREREGATKDHLFGKEFLREIYLQADPNYTGRVTVPVLWDKESGTIVNNESREILRMMATTFKDVGSGTDLSPRELREEIDRVMDAIYQPINNGVYKSGFAKSQEAYDEAVTELFQALDNWEEKLGERDYLVGDSPTEADIAMFTTLVRFDPVYSIHFKCSKKRIADYPNLYAYLQRLRSLPAIAETVDMGHIRNHYYQSHNSINPYRIVAVAPSTD